MVLIGSHDNTATSRSAVGSTPKKAKHASPDTPMLQNDEMVASDTDRDAGKAAILGSLPSSQLSYSDNDIRLVSKRKPRLSPDSEKSLKKKHSDKIRKPRFKLPVEFDIALLVAEMKSQRLESTEERRPPSKQQRPGTPIPRQEPNQRRMDLRYID